MFELESMEEKLKHDIATLDVEHTERFKNVELRLNRIVLATEERYKKEMELQLRRTQMI